MALVAKTSRVLSVGVMCYKRANTNSNALIACFVYSEADPKGIDCVEAFKGMQGEY